MEAMMGCLRGAAPVAMKVAHWGGNSEIATGLHLVDEKARMMVFGRASGMASWTVWM